MCPCGGSVFLWVRSNLSLSYNVTWCILWPGSLCDVYCCDSSSTPTPWSDSTWPWTHHAPGTSCQGQPRWAQTVGCNQDDTHGVILTSYKYWMLCMINMRVYTTDCWHHGAFRLLHSILSCGKVFVPQYCWKISDHPQVLFQNNPHRTCFACCPETKLGLPLHPQRKSKNIWLFLSEKLMYALNMLKSCLRTHKSQ